MGKALLLPLLRRQEALKLVSCLCPWVSLGSLPLVVGLPKLLVLLKQVASKLIPCLCSWTPVASLPKQDAPKLVSCHCPWVPVWDLPLVMSLPGQAWVYFVC
ncbi:hypothetical protein IWZ03DRAFT_381383 [Phyllosticta citriasiana]|uniref:Uncharacterized protein n=1 Tax=Phyllosticta citriasiana TaxID=595635 RepID=A0ABR1KGX9_9PEZI